MTKTYAVETDVHGWRIVCRLSSGSILWAGQYNNGKRRQAEKLCAMWNAEDAVHG
jgi:hypothetical protein